MGRQQVDGYERARKRIESTLPEITLRQLEDLAERLAPDEGKPLSRSKVIELAVGRLWEEHDPAASPALSVQQRKAEIAAHYAEQQKRLKRG